jgi:hypothetical protein
VSGLRNGVVCDGNADRGVEDAIGVALAAEADSAPAVYRLIRCGPKLVVPTSTDFPEWMFHGRPRELERANAGTAAAAEIEPLTGDGESVDISSSAPTDRRRPDPSALRLFFVGVDIKWLRNKNNARE